MWKRVESMSTPYEADWDNAGGNSCSQWDGATWEGVQIRIEEHHILVTRGKEGEWGRAR